MAQYKTQKGGQLVHIHPSSVLFAASGGRFKKLPKHVVFADVLITTRQYMKNVSVIDESWLEEMRCAGTPDISNISKHETSTKEKH